jgi:hypothetical protein
MLSYLSNHCATALHGCNYGNIDTGSDKCAEYKPDSPAKTTEVARNRVAIWVPVGSITIHFRSFVAVIT